MKKYAILCGCAPDGFTQKKINEMHDFLTSEGGGSWAEKEITIFPNGVTEAMLSFVLERLKSDKTEQILLYVCTLSPVEENEKSVWLGDEEVRKSVIGAFATADSDNEIDLQVVYDSCREFTSDEEMEVEEDVLERKMSSLSLAKAGE